MPDFFDREGNPVQAYGPEAQEAFLGGHIGLAPGSVLTVVGPDGKRYQAPAESLSEALRSGFRFETGEEHEKSRLESEYGGENVQAGLEGAARGLTLGVSDAFLKGAGVEGVGERKKANPDIAFTSEVAGMIAPSFFSGGAATGPGLAAKAGAATERALLGEGAEAIGKAALKQVAKKPTALENFGAEMTRKVISGADTVAGRASAQAPQVAERIAAQAPGLARQVAARAAGNAVEGGLYGLGASISEESLGDHELNAEKLLAGTLAGALTGGALGTGGKFIEAGGSKLMEKYGGQGIRESLEKYAQKRAVAAFAERSDFKRGKLKDIEDIGKYALENGLSAGDTAETVAARFGAKKAEEGAVINEVLQKVSERKPNFDLARLNAKVQKEILDPLANSPAQKGAHNALANLLEDYQGRALTGQNTWEWAWAEQAALRRQLGDGDPLKPAQAYLKKFRQMFRDEIKDQAGAVSPHFKEQLDRVGLRYRAAAKMEELGKKQSEKLGNRFISPSDYLAGGIGMIANPVAGIGLAAANHYGRHHAGSFFAVTLDKLAKSKSLERMSKFFQKTTLEKLKNPMAFGPYRGLIETAAARGAMDLVATHIQLARTDPNYLSEAGMQDETPDAANQAAVVADKLDRLATVIEARDADMDRSMGRFLGQQGGRAPSYERSGDMLSEYDARMASLAKLISDPRAAAEALSPGELTDAAPSHAMQLTAKATQAAKFLYDRAPKNPYMEAIPALAPEWQPSDVDMERWFRYVDAVENPMKVVEELREGTVTVESREALQTVYPRLLEELQQRMMERLAGYKGSLSYEQKLALSMLFDQPVGEAGNNDKLALLQDMDVASMEAAQQAQQKSSGSSGGTSSNWATMDQLLTQRANQI